MIIKELDPINLDDKYSKAGHEAEKQMAYYLKHKYFDSKTIHIINNLRFNWLDDFTQIDHLVIHDYGMIIIESKSVSTKVKYNEYQEWFRLWNNHWEGMLNPVEQAERQANNLKNFLNTNREILLKKVFGKTIASFDKMPVDCIVAISDKCKDIIRTKIVDYSNVCKADLVTKKIDATIAGYKKDDSALSLKVPWRVSDASKERIKNFLLESHTPIKENSKKSVEKNEDNFQAVQNVAATSLSFSNGQPEEEKEKIYTLTECPDCRGNLSIIWGAKYKNYYWKCNNCGKNIPIKEICPECKQKLKIRKQKSDYFIYCQSCQLEAHYHRSGE